MMFLPILIVLLIHLNHWKCDDGAGTTVDDIGSLNMDGTITGTSGYTAQGTGWEWNKSVYNLNQIGSGSVSGSATISGGTWNLRDSTYLKFDEVGDYIDVGDTNQLEQDSITISGWFWIDSTKSAALNFLACNSDGANAGWRLYVNNSDELVFLKDTNSITIDATDLMDQWVHITASYASTNMNVYINGILHTHRSDITGDLTYPSCTFDIGADGQRPTAGWFYKGYMRDVIFYKTVLTASQVDLLYKGQWVGAPVGWWKLNEGSGAIAIDSGVNNTRRR